MEKLNPQKVLTTEGLREIQRGHPWLKASMIKDRDCIPRSPCVLPLGEHWFLVSPHSEIRLRRLGPSLRHWPNSEEKTFKTIFTENEFKSTFSESLKWLWVQAFQRKHQLLGGETCLRWLYAENDFIPGLVVDVYHDQLVAQIQSAPIEHFWPALRDILLEAAHDVQPNIKFKLHEHRQNRIREKEGLETEPFQGGVRAQVLWNGLKWNMHPGGSQKTGSYLDQHDNHLRTLFWAQKLKSQSAWDVCCFEGGFALHLAKAGLKVKCVDVSTEALGVLAENAKANEISEDRIEIVHADAFEFMKTMDDKGEKVDLIILDPPSFAKSKGEREGALKGFRELNRRALHCLNPGGLLVSCSCTHHVSEKDYAQVLRQSAHESRRSVKVLEQLGPSPDHSSQVLFPESRYLQAWFLLVE